MARDWGASVRRAGRLEMMPRNPVAERASSRAARQVVAQFSAEHLTALAQHFEALAERLNT